MDNLEVSVDFIINNPQVMEDSERVKSQLKGIATTSENASNTARKSMEKLFEQSKDNAEALASSTSKTLSNSERLIAGFRKDLEKGLITAKELDAQIARINNAGVSPAPIKKKTAESVKRPKFSDDYNGVAGESQIVYAGLDKDTQRLIAREKELQSELESVKKAQKELNAAFENGAIIGDRYTRSQAVIASNEIQIRAELKSTTSELNNRAKAAEAEALRSRNLKKGSSGNDLSNNYQTVVSDSTALYTSLNATTQKLIVKNVELKNELTAVNLAQTELDVAFEKGIVTDAEYANAQKMLAANEVEIRAAIKATTAELAKQSKEAELAAIRTVNAGQAGFDKFGNALKKPTGQIERMKYAAKAYEEMSQKALNPEIVKKYNLKFQETKEEISRMSNVGKKGFDELGNKIKGSTSMIGKAWAGVRMLANILPGIGVAGILAFAIEPIMNYVSKLDLFAQKINETTRARKAMNEMILKGTQNAQADLINLKLLFTAYQNGNLNLKARKEAYGELQKMYPDYFKNLKFEQTASTETKKSYDALAVSILATARARAAADKLAENSSRALDNEFKINELQIEKAKKQAELKIAENTNKNAEQVHGGGAQGAAIGNLVTAKKVYSITKDIEAIQKNINDHQTDTNILKEREVKLTEYAQKQIAAGGKLTGGESKSGTEKSDGAQALVRQEETIAQRVQAIRDKYIAKSKTKEEEARLAIVSEFKKLSDDLAAQAKVYDDYVKKYGKQKAAAKGLKRPDVSVVEPLEKSALADFDSRQKTDEEIKEYEAKKQIYQQYEAYKLEFGKQKATERYASEIKDYDNYVSYLKSKLPAETDQSAGANAMRDYLKKAQAEAQTDQNQKNFDETAKYLKNVLEATKLASVEKLAIEKKYLEDVVALKNDPTLTEVERAARTTKLDENKKQELKANSQLAFQEGAYFKEAMKDVTNASLAELKQRIRDAKNELANSKLTPEERKAVNGKLAAAENGLQDKGFTIDKYGQTINMNSKVAEQANKIKEYAMASSSSFMEMSQALADTSPNAAATLETLGDIAAVAGNAAASVASFASGDIVGGIQSALSTVTSIISIGAKSRESERKAMAELKNYQDSLIQGEYDLNREMRNRARTQSDINALTRQELEDRKVLLSTQASQSKADYDKQLALIRESGKQVTNSRTEKYGGVFGIGKKTRVVYDYADVGNTISYEELEKLSIIGNLDEATQKLFAALKLSHDEMDSIGDSAEEVAKTINDKLTAGVTADSISNTIVEGFKEGKRAVADFADDTEKIISDALLSALSYTMMSKPLKELVEQFSEDAKDGLDAEEIGKFKTSLGSITDTFLKSAKAVEEATGINLSPGTSKANSTSGALQKAVTEDSANIFIGIARGSYELVKRQLNVMIDNSTMFRTAILTFAAIEKNTAATAKNTDGLIGKLQEIADNTKPTSDGFAQALRNGGIKG